VAVLGYLLLQYQLKRVEKFDQLHRREQRAMQNREVEKIFMKKVRYSLFKPDGSELDRH
jgi:hypothetical protein